MRLLTFQLSIRLGQAAAVGVQEGREPGRVTEHGRQGVLRGACVFNGRCEEASEGRLAPRNSRAANDILARLEVLACVLFATALK